jgi:DNA-binding response OmpR family regulator
MIAAEPVAKASVLVVDDEMEIRQSLGEILSARYQVACAANAGEGMQLATQLKPAVVLLDIYMPGGDGVSFCQAIRANIQTKDIPVIMMTAMDVKDTRIRAFDSGADDFLAKPFQVDELFSRINAKLRWSRERERTCQPSHLTIGDLSLDLYHAKAFLAGTAIDLGAIEFKILATFGLRRGELVKRGEIEEMIWEGDLPATRSLDTHIASLRRKIGPSQLALRTVYGEGYVLE